MAELIELSVTQRSGTGKGAARQARRENLVPGVVYGGGVDPQPVNVKYNELFKLLKKGKFLSTLINLNIGGEETRAICRNVQRDPVKDLPTHVDFLRLSRKSRINLFIEVEFVNQEESPGLKRGGVLTVVRPEVELKVTAGDIPEKLTADLTGLDVGDVITISSLPMPEGARPMITDRDFVIANISAPSSLRSADEDEEEGAEATEADEAAEAADGEAEAES